MELISLHQPEEFRKGQKEIPHVLQERSKGDTTCLTTSQNPSLWHPSWLNKACTTRKDSESEWLAKDNPETNLITIKPKTASHVTELFSWIPLPYCSPPGCPFPVKSLALSVHGSPQTIHFWVLNKSPVSGPGRGPSSCNSSVCQLSLNKTGGEGNFKCMNKMRIKVKGCDKIDIRKVDFFKRSITRNKEGCFILIKRLIHQDIKIRSVCIQKA